jgi:glycine betaine/proline transport system substrate-binding protein
VAWIGMKDKWPAAYRFLKLLTVTNEIQIPLMKAIDVNNQDLVSVIKKWVDDNEDIWRPWVTEAMK